MLKVRHVRSLFIWRYYCFIRYLFRKVRVQPKTVLNTRLARLMFDQGVVIGRNARLSTSNGTIVLEQGVWLASDVEFDTESCIRIGKRTTVQRRSTINGTVTLGSDCIIAPNVFISSGTHPFREFKDKTVRDQERAIIARDGNLNSIDHAVTVGNDCWLCVNVVLCPGVTIGDHCVVGANSVVTKDLPAFSVVAGVPARVIGSR